MRKLDAAGNTATADKTKPQYVTAAQFAALVPNDGDECYLIADATNGVLWHFRYNAGSASAYKWEFLGGAPLFGKNNNGATGVTSTTYVDLGGPQFVLARGGDYEWTLSATLANNTGTAFTVIVAKLSGVAALDIDAISWQAFGAGAQATDATIGSYLGVVAGATLGTWVRVTSGQGTFSSVRLSVRPIRIS